MFNWKIFFWLRQFVIRQNGNKHPFPYFTERQFETRYFEKPCYLCYVPLNPWISRTYSKKSLKLETKSDS